MASQPLGGAFDFFSFASFGSFGSFGSFVVAFEMGTFVAFFATFPSSL
jgi:hypothetical protein